MKKNNILKMSLCSMMAFGALMSPMIVSAEENVSPVEDVVNYNKAKLENLSLYAFNHMDGTKPNFDSFYVGDIYSFDYKDTVENKKLGSNSGNYFHMTYENLSPDILEMSIFEDDAEPALKIESRDSGGMNYTGVKLSGLKEGNAKIKCTIYDISNPELTKTEIVTISFSNKNSNTTTEEKTDISFSGGSDDFLSKDEMKTQVLNTINSTDKNVTINLLFDSEAKNISLPKDILDAAKNKNIPLTVNVEVNGMTTTWTFNNMDKTMDINLAMNLLNISDIDTLKEKDGLVLSFNHSGELPTGTVVKTYVGIKYKAGDKVQLSYFNNLTNSLEETKEYIVDSEGYVSVVINHCSNYVLEKVVENTNNETTTPSDNSTKNETNTNKTSTSSTYHVAEKPEVPNTGIEDFTMLFGQFIVSGSGLAYMLKRRK